MMSGATRSIGCDEGCSTGWWWRCGVVPPGVLVVMRVAPQVGGGGVVTEILQQSQQIYNSNHLIIYVYIILKDIDYYRFYYFRFIIRFINYLQGDQLKWTRAQTKCTTPCLQHLKSNISTP
jgi:hypothetical protein